MNPVRSGLQTDSKDTNMWEDKYVSGTTPLNREMKSSSLLQTDYLNTLHRSPLAREAEREREGGEGKERKGKGRGERGNHKWAMIRSNLSWLSPYRILFARLPVSMPSFVLPKLIAKSTFTSGDIDIGID